MRTKLVRIGNSRGVRIPSLMLKECGLSGEVDLEARGRQLVIQPAGKPRSGWTQAFQVMAAEGDDALLDAETATETNWEREEWEW